MKHFAAVAFASLAVLPLSLWPASVLPTTARSRTSSAWEAPRSVPRRWAPLVKAYRRDSSAARLASRPLSGGEGDASERLASNETGSDKSAQSGEECWLYRPITGAQQPSGRQEAR